MPRKYQNVPTGYTILVVDDSPDILESTRRLLETEGHHVLTAHDGPTALRVLERERVALILLDYFLPGITGDEVVRRVREADRVVQIVLVTGYAGEKPARAMMRQLDIQGYHGKSEGAERLLLWVDAALNTYRHALAAERHRAGLRFMLDAAPQMYQAQPLDELLEKLLAQASEMQGVESAFLATIPPGMIAASIQADGPEFPEAPIEIRFGKGRFRAGMPLDALSEPERSMVREILHRGSIEVRGNRSVIPLRPGARPTGIIYLDGGAEDAHERKLLEAFANQAGAAIHNAVISQVAATDTLTGVFIGSFAMRRLGECLKSGQRRGEPVSLLMVDVTRFREIVGRHGHEVGDQALGAVAALLQRSVRETDVVGRCAEGEFMVVLPGTAPEGARVVGSRMLLRMEELALRSEGEAVPLHLSIGVGTLHCCLEDGEPVASTQDFAVAARELVAHARRARSASERTGVLEQLPPMFWTDVLAAGTAAAPAQLPESPAEREPEPAGARTTDHVDTPRTEPVTGTKQPGSPVRRRLRVLVVDDEETVRRSLILYLRRLGHEVSEAQDGRDALRLIDGVAGEAGYDVILSDLKMPRLSGDQLLVKLQERGDQLYRRIIFLSGDEPSGDAARILAAAGSQVVLKPYDLSEISRLVERCAGGSDGGHTLNAGYPRL